MAGTSSSSQTPSNSDVASGTITHGCTNTNIDESDNLPRGDSEDILLNKLFDELAKRKKHDSKIKRHLTDQNSILNQLLLDVKEMKLREGNTDYTAITAELRRTNLEVLNSVIGMAEAVNCLSKEVDDMKAEAELIREDRREQIAYIRTLEQKVLNRQQQPRSSFVQLIQIKQEESESSASLIQIVCDIGANIGVQISETDLRDVYRQQQLLPSNAPAPIIVEFSTVHKMQSFFDGLIACNQAEKKQD